MTHGSSPLARGLQYPGGPGKLDQRIIPARAGFTRHDHPHRPTHGDHPRSRGVYSARLTRSRRLTGSSPLARGLLGRTLWRLLILRIIPARAGFTAMDMAACLLNRDHPRSRGVYGGMGAGHHGLGGSSPLARGLPANLASCATGQRIIPARAGFTRWGGRGWLLGPDHPRSRGVYP